MFRRSLIFSVVVLLIALFQNCSNVNHSASSSSSASHGGEGTDGKLYLSYGLCPSGKVDIASSVLVTSDLQSASLLQQNCARLPKPQSLDMKTLNFGMDNPSAFALSGTAFDLQTVVASQQVTVNWCRSDNDDIEVRIWRSLSSASGLFGSITQNTGENTEALLLDPSVTSAGNYATFPNQQSQFSMTSSGGVVSVSFSVDGGATKTVSGFKCATQAQPPLPPLASSLPPPAGYSASHLKFEDQFTGSSLDSSKWIPQIADQSGVWRQSVPAPYSASNAGGYDAEFFDPAHVITGGGLNLVATRDTTYPGYTWRSGCISSHGLFYLSSGYVQFRARFPDSSAGMWAAVSFMEGGSTFDLSSGFLGGFNPNHNVTASLKSAGNSDIVYNSGVDLSADYHVYGVEYKPGVSLKMYVDGALFATYTSNIPTGAYEIIVKLMVAQNAVTWHTQADGTTLSPSEFDISDIQVYNLPP